MKALLVSLQAVRRKPLPLLVDEAPERGVAIQCGQVLLFALLENRENLLGGLRAGVGRPLVHQAFLAQVHIKLYEFGYSRRGFHWQWPISRVERVSLLPSHEEL